MKKIGREVLFLATDAQNPRNGEGSFLRLADGRVMYAYTEYYGDSWEDHATARIAAVIAVEGGFLFAYHHSGGSDVCLNCNRITELLCPHIQEANGADAPRIQKEEGADAFRHKRKQKSGRQTPPVYLLRNGRGS